MVDNAPVVIEFGPGSCTCRGDMTGCAVCSTASTLLRYGKSIPRLANGTPNMVSLGTSMGNRHRAVSSITRHGLSLKGQCSPPNGGTNWCGYCAYLELRAHGLLVGYGALSDSQILAHLKQGHSLIFPGLYSRIPLVSESSYSKTVPAKGRSDSGFGGWHMVAAHGVILNSKGTPLRAIVADPDFGSPSRPVVPPHSEWAWDKFLSYYHATGGWGICYVQNAPPPPPPSIVGPYRVTIEHGAIVRIYPTKTQGGELCINSDPKTWVNDEWDNPKSSAPCYGVRHLRTCDGESGADTVLVRDGTYRGRRIRVGAAYGVTVKKV